MGHWHFDKISTGISQIAVYIFVPHACYDEIRLPSNPDCLSFSVPGRSEIFIFTDNVCVVIYKALVASRCQYWSFGCFTHFEDFSYISSNLYIF